MDFAILFVSVVLFVISVLAFRDRSYLGLVFFIASGIVFSFTDYGAALVETIKTVPQ